jgi:hypothetical protein
MSNLNLKQDQDAQVIKCLHLTLLLIHRLQSGLKSQHQLTVSIQALHSVEHKTLYTYTVMIKLTT